MLAEVLFSFDEMRNLVLILLCMKLFACCFMQGFNFTKMCINMAVAVAVAVAVAGMNHRYLHIFCQN